MEINRKEIYGYLGYKSADPGEDIKKRVEESIQKITDACRVRSVFRKYPVIIDEENNRVDIETMKIKSRNLCRNLFGCTHVYLFALTLGIEVDRMIKRMQIFGMLDTAICQASAAGVTEAFCNSLNDEIKEMEARNGNLTRPRYSPGYGDFSLSHQGEFLKLIDAFKETGITLTDGDLMIPSKSVTAVIGVYKG